MSWRRQIATIYGVAIFMAGAATKEAWTSAGMPLTPDGGKADGLLALLLLCLGLLIERAQRTS